MAIDTISCSPCPPPRNRCLPPLREPPLFPRLSTPPRPIARPNMSCPHGAVRHPQTPRRAAPAPHRHAVVVPNRRPSAPYPHSVVRRPYKRLAVPPGTSSPRSHPAEPLVVPRLFDDNDQQPWACPWSASHTPTPSAVSLSRRRPSPVWLRLQSVRCRAGGDEEAAPEEEASEPLFARELLQCGMILGRGRTAGGR
ncbi:hypothetical protein U9M48_021277 [Paspalum notatum var. saurae]|uniref:Uncharacterized protein n=1 Tax=Paspalum notatum var. saurae TaxID=547442 RepID=A0AAQ3THA8_PASNO